MDDLGLSISLSQGLLCTLHNGLAELHRGCKSQKSRIVDEVHCTTKVIGAPTDRGAVGEIYPLFTGSLVPVSL